MSNEDKFIDFCIWNKGVQLDEEKKVEFRRLGRLYLKALLRKIESIFPLPEKEIHYNPSGPAMSGDHRLMAMFNNELGFYIFFNLEASADLGICYRTIKYMKDYTGGPNNWISFNSARDLDAFANRILGLRGCVGIGKCVVGDV